jgi:hypothetical protein
MARPGAAGRTNPQLGVGAEWRSASQNQARGPSNLNGTRIGIAAAAQPRRIRRRTSFLVRSLNSFGV